MIARATGDGFLRKLNKTVAAREGHCEYWNTQIISKGSKIFQSEITVDTIEVSF